MTINKQARPFAPTLNSYFQPTPDPAVLTGMPAVTAFYTLGAHAWAVRFPLARVDLLAAAALRIAADPNFPPTAIAALRCHTRRLVSMCTKELAELRRSAK